MTTNIIDITSISELNAILAASPDKLTVCYRLPRHMVWSCKVIAPTFLELAEAKPNCNFLKCDVDQAQDVAREYGVMAMPTFIFMRGTKKVAEVKGADQAELKATVEDFSVGSPGVTTPFSGKGQTLGGTPAPAAPGIGTDGIINLTPQTKVLLGLVVAYLVLWYLA